MRLDLHRHLEGSHSPTALAAVAKDFDVRDPVFWDEARKQHRSPDELVAALTLQQPSDDARLFYACITKARAAYVSEAAIAALSKRAFVEAAADTDGFEMRISLFSMTRTLLEHEGKVWRDLEPTAFAERARRLLLVVLGARDEAIEETQTPMLVRVGFSRTFESAVHYEALADLLPEHKSALSGLDVLGIVTGADTEPMPDALRAILLRLRKDLPDLTVHAGEFADHRSVERTLSLEPQGIGHGVHAVESDAVMARLRDEGVTVEVCPTSNRLLIPSALARLEARRAMTPLRALQQARVHCVLGSDDPTPMGTTFGNEWQTASSLGVDMQQLQRDSQRRWAQLVPTPSTSTPSSPSTIS